jgi:outer membrane receptor protein involved in Fe transport
LRGFAISVLLAASIVGAAPRTEAAARATLDVRGGPMAAALADLARQTQIEILFDPRLVRELTARPLRGRLSSEAALSKLLAGSGVGYRTTPGGAFALFAIPAPRPVEAGDGAVAELLVVGRRTQNADIRRTENDIQPYKVFGQAEIETAARATIDEFLRVREPANTQAGPLALGGGENRSAIDLRGFGETSTLVLVDGRRMPFVPSLVGDFNQADINGIPPGAVERIEVLTGTAGGIFGPGAIGGVVNVVLRRDYRGAELTAHAGGSDRGDSRQFRMEGRLGFTPDHGDTDVMLFISHGEAEPLQTGRRDYVESAGRLRFANNPDAYAISLPIRNGVSVASLDGNLSLDAAHGGAALGAAYTFLPLGFSGTSADSDARLVANAGKLPLDIADDLSGRRADIATAGHITSGLANVRHRLGSRAEVFLDGFYLRNTGRWTGAQFPRTILLSADARGNPFDQAIALSFPVGLLGDETSYTIETSRWSAGAIVDLPGGWKGTADYTLGRSTYRRDMRGADIGILTAIASGEPGADGEPPLAPFGDWSAFVAALPAYSRSREEQVHLKGRLLDASIRLSGPLLALPGGPLTATLLGEDREDRVSGSQIVLSSKPLALPARVQRVRSGYFELRAPLGASDAGSLLLRGLEVQLAVRHDRSVHEDTLQVLLIGGGDNSRFSTRHDTTMFTAGARVLPTPRLMLRASLASGSRPPTLADLQGVNGFRLPGAEPVEDPRRPGRPLGSEGTWKILMGGSTRVGSSDASSFTVGAVLNPEGRGGPRLSLDYSRTTVSHEPARFPLDLYALLATEAQYPERVIRAPVTAADKADGFAVGRVTALDTTLINAGRTEVEAVDFQVDWRLPARDSDEVRLYGALTWEPTFTTRGAPGAAAIKKVGYADGPLEWRGNAGVEWRRGPLVVDLNAQYYDSYRVRYADPASVGNPQIVRDQGAERVPAQIYVDLSMRRRFTAPLGPRPLRALEVRLSIHNLFDRSPPIVAASPALGFSEYGDPRRRRFAATLSAQF